MTKLLNKIIIGNAPLKSDAFPLFYGQFAYFAFNINEAQDMDKRRKRYNLKVASEDKTEAVDAVKDVEIEDKVENAGDADSADKTHAIDTSGSEDSSLDDSSESNSDKESFGSKRQDERKDLESGDTVERNHTVRDNGSGYDLNEDFDDDQDDDDDDQDEESVGFNRANVNRIKKMILATVAALIIIPTVISICLFVKVMRLEKELDDYKKRAYAEEVSKENDLAVATKADAESADNNPSGGQDTGFGSLHQKSLDEQISMYSEVKNDLLQSNEAGNTSELQIVDRDITENVLEDTSSTEEISKEAVEKESVLSSKELVKPLNLNGKKVYITFDDGPSSCTGEILDILKEKDVQATFFVVGKDEKFYPEYQRIVDEGHTLAMHSYTHDYGKIYASIDAFKEDVEKLHKLLLDVTGYDAKLYRFPGGSSNEVSSVDMKKCAAYLKEKGYIYFDWNAQNGDAVEYYISPEELNQNVMGFVRSNEGDSVILMHDLETHHNTVEALPDLIDQLKAEGYEILPLTTDTTPVRHRDLDK